MHDACPDMSVSPLVISNLAVSLLKVILAGWEPWSYLCICNGLEAIWLSVFPLRQCPLRLFCSQVPAAALTLCIRVTLCMPAVAFAQRAPQMEGQTLLLLLTHLSVDSFLTWLMGST